MSADALLVAARSGDKTLMAQALSSGVDIDMLLDEDCGQWTPLHMLAADGDVDACRMLLEAGARVSHPCTGDEYEALHLAARNGHIAVAELLIDSGASVDAVDKHGYTPLHYSAAFGHPLMASVLLRRGASAAVKDNMGCGAAQLAKAAGHDDAYTVIANSASVEAGIGRVARWLTAIGLLEHAQKFVDAGLDDLDFIAEVGLSDADVDKLGIEKLGHRKKLTALYRVREFLGPAVSASNGDISAGGGDVEGDGEDEKGTEASDSAAGSDDESDEGSGDSDDDSDEEDDDEEDSDAGSDDSGDDSDES